MSKQKSLILAWGVIILFLIVWRIAAIQTFTTTPTELGASIIDPEDIQVDTDTLIPSSASSLPADPDLELWQTQIPDEFRGTTRILIPPHISAQELMKLTSTINIAQNTDVIAIFDQSKTIESYIQALSSWEYDIALTTPNHIQEHDLDHISLPLDPSMRSGIHPSAQQAARRQNIFFVPFALDPYVVALHKSIPGEIESRSELQRRIALYPETDMTPHGFGISDLDTKIAQTGEHVLDMYADIQTYIQLATSNTQKSDLSRLILSNKSYDSSSLLKSAFQNRTNDPLCKTDKMSCLDSQEQFQAIVWPYHALADIDQSYRYMILDDADPLIRWRVVNPESKDRLAILGWILWYLQQAPQSNLPLWDNTLPVFIDNLDITLSRKQLSNMREWLE